MYDKFGIVLRIETTTNDVSSFKHYRKVEHRKGPSSTGFAPMKKNIYSLGDLAGILFACNRRYLAHLSALDDFSAGVKLLDRVTRPRKVEGKTVKGIDFFNPTGTNAAARPAEPQVQHCRCPPRRSRAHCLRKSPPPRSHARSGGCAISASSNASLKPTATTSPAPDAPSSPPPPTSPNTPSSQRSLDRFRAENDKSWLVRHSPTAALANPCAAISRHAPLCSSCST